MIKPFFKYVKRVRLKMWINSMERILKKAERKCESWDNSYFNSLDLFHFVYIIDDHIEDCQEAIKALRKEGEEVFKDD